MVRSRSRIDITCQNILCNYYLIEEGKDIIKRGKNRAGNQQYFCNHCNRWFVETKNTLFFHKHLSKNEIIIIIKYLVENKGIRSIERLTGHHRDTICRLIDDMMEHADIVNEFVIHEVKLTSKECDDLWFFLKKRKNIKFRKINYIEEVDI